jgi:Leu/Phe-tRNA-protein transferase
VIRIPILHAGVREPFPPVETAFDEPNGLLAAGGDLAPERLLEAYRHGIFPWFSEGEPILWWSPDPRMVFATGKVHVSTRMRRWLRHCDWTIRADTMFFGESMFSSATNGSKVALLALCRALHGWDFPLVDAQVASPHLERMGAVEMPRSQFVAHVAEYSVQPPPDLSSWRQEWPLPRAADLAG